MYYTHASKFLVRHFHVAILSESEREIGFFDEYGALESFQYHEESEAYPDYRHDRESARYPFSGFRVQGSGFRAQGSGFRVSGFMLQVSGLRVEGSAFRVQGSGLRVQGPGFWDLGFGFQVAYAIPDIRLRCDLCLMCFYHKESEACFDYRQSYRGTSLIRNHILLGPYRSLCLGS